MAISLSAKPSKTDLMYEILYNWNFVPQPSPKVNVKTGIYDGKERYFMKNHELDTLYELDKTSFDIWNLLDGKRGMGQILGEMETLHPEVLPTTTLQSVLFFAESGALRATLEPEEKKRVSFTSALRIHVTLVQKSENFLKAIHRMVKPLLRRELLWVSLVFVIAAGMAFAGQFLRILGDKSSFELFGSTIVGLFIYNFVILAPATAIHEIAHGLTVVHYGGVPKDMGTGWFYFGPMFYCDATDAYTFTRRRRMMVMLAGNLSTMLIGSAIVVTLFVLPLPAGAAGVLSMTAFWCFYTSLWNFAPPFETDGYYVLSDLLKMPNLRHDAYDYLKTAIKKLLKRPLEETSELTKKTKRILLGYAIMSVVWLVYMAYQSFTLMTYMARDAAVAAANVSSAIMLPGTLSASILFVSLASIVYFTIMISGYSLVLFSGVRKAATRALKFEAIHDRDFSISLYLPAHVPKKIVASLQQHTMKIARRITRNFTVAQQGPLTVTVMRIGGGSMALVQIKNYLQKTEKAFTSMYEGFLRENRREILASSDIHSSKGIPLTDLLRRLSRESAKSGQPEAKNIVDHLIREGEKHAIYLLNSAVGRVWTIEMPPSQQYEAQRSLFPMFCVEDSAFTDLYEQVEDFKKRTIYGYDSLEKLAVQAEACLSQTLEHQEEYQAVAFMQPVRGRLLFIGRTEQIEASIDRLGSLFVDQVWFGYMDNLLADTNHMLSALTRTILPSIEEINQMSDGELATLENALSDLNSNMPSVEHAVTDCEQRLQTANGNSEEMRRILEPRADFKIGVIEPTLTLNEENMKNLPKRFRDFRKHFGKLRDAASDVEGIVRKERRKRESEYEKKKAKTLRLYPIVLILSVAMLAVGLGLAVGTVTYALVGGGLALQLAYWSLYALGRNRARTLSRYPSATFNQMHTFVLGLVQATHQFAATGNVLSPTKINPQTEKERRHEASPKK